MTAYSDAIADIIKTTPFRWEEDAPKFGCARDEPPGCGTDEQVAQETMGAYEIADDRQMIARRLCEIFSSDPDFDAEEFLQACGFDGRNQDEFVKAHGLPPYTDC